MPKFRKKPVIIEAVQWTGYNIPEIEYFMAPDPPQYLSFLSQGAIGIPTLEGTMIAKPGDWIIKGIQGEFYPCKPDIFQKTYEAVASDGQ